MDQLAPGVAEENKLRTAGFTEEEVGQWRAQTAQKLSQSGFASNEIDEYFGYKNPDMTPMKKVFEENAKAAQTTVAEGQPKEAKTFMEAVEAGWQISVAGLIKNQKAPEMIATENTPMFYRVASNVATLAGDLPAMWAGGQIGAMVGTPAGAAVGTAVAPGPGTAIGATGGAVLGGGYGAMALPAAIRKVMMDHYEKGDVENFQDFWGRAAGTFIEANKQGLIGAATMGTGKVVGGVAGKLGASAAVKTTSQLTSEVATMTTLGAALEGHMPEPEHFIEAAMVVGAMKGVGVGATKLRRTYAETAVKPEEVAQRAQHEPLVKQDLLTEDVMIPDPIARENGLPTSSDVTAQVKNLKNFASEKVSGLKEGAEAPPVTRSEATEKILSKIGEPVEPDAPKYTFRKAYTDFVDKFDPINQIVKQLEKDPENLKVEENPYQLARMSNDSKSKVKYVMEKGALDYETLGKSGKSFKEITGKIKDIEEFDAYLAAKRAVEVEGRGLKSGFDVEAAKELVKSGKEKYETASKEMVEFQNNNLKYLKDSGFLSNESFKEMVEVNKSYIPYKRLLEGEGSSGKKGSSLGQLKEFVGSDAKIQSPLLSVLENTEALYKVAEKNRAARSLVELAEKNPDQELLSKVKSKSQAIEIKPEDVAKILKAHGTDVENVEAFTVFGKKGKTPLKENEFEVYRNGKREVWETADPEVAKAVRAMDGDPVSNNVFFKLSRGISGVKRLSISLMPDFILKNFFRDQITAGAFSKYGSIPFFDTLVAMKDVMGKSDAYYNWMKSGGAGGTFLELDQTYLSKDIFKLNKETGFMDKTWNYVKTPYEALKAAGAIAEQSTRLAQFKRASGGAESGSKLLEGGFAAREITVDFTRIGAKMSALNAITAFQNVSIQGLDRTIRAVKENPAGVTSKAIAGITVPSLLLYWANKDDKRYQEIPRWQKDMFWIIPTDNWVKAEQGELEAGIPDHLLRTNKDGDIEINKGAIYRLPKPQELGILFGSLPERVMEKFFNDNPNATKDFHKTMMNLVTPSLVPDIAAPFVEQSYDRGIFTGTKIIPGYLEKIAPEYQYTEYTTESAKQLSKMIAMVPGVGSEKEGDLSVSSPIVLENYVRAWSGNLGMYALKIADQGLIKSGAVPDPVKPADTLADIPFVKAFVVRYPSAGAQSLQEFYDRYSKNSQKYETIMYLAKTGDLENLQKEVGDPDLAGKIANLSGVKDALSTQSQVIRIINKNADYNPDEKRQLIDGIYYGMIEATRAANEAMRELDKELKNKAK